MMQLSQERQYHWLQRLLIAGTWAGLLAWGGSANATEKSEIILPSTEVSIAPQHRTLNNGEPPILLLTEMVTTELPDQPPSLSTKPDRESAPDLEPQKIDGVDTDDDSGLPKVSGTTDSRSAISDTMVNPNTEDASTAPESLLVGVVLLEEEIGSLDIIKMEDSYWLPLADFAEMVGIELKTDQQATIVTTPLGTTTFLPAELRQIDNIVYIRDRLLQEKLLVQIQFDQAQFALNVELPWTQAVSESDSAPPGIVPDVRPIDTTLSTLRTSSSMATQGGDINADHSTLLGGQLLGGTWQVNVDNTVLGTQSNGALSPRFSEYFYQNQVGPLQYLVGRQQLSLHPLLNGLDITGAQFAYTNRPSLESSSLLENGNLLLQRTNSAQSLSGTAPPASFVQLRIDGIVVDEQQVGLDGQYVFLQVPLFVGSANRIELLIFERNNRRVPIETRVVSFNASDLLLPANTFSHIAGLGLSGNLVQNLFEENPDANTAGQPVAFYQWRQGFSDNFTIETTVQRLPQTFQAQAGLTWRIANPLVLSLNGGANAQGDLAYQLDLSAQLEAWQVLLNSEQIPAQFNGGNSTLADQYNHSLEVSYQANPNLTVGAIARRQHDGTTFAQYILPTINWRPTGNIYLSGRPDRLGNYLMNANYSPTPDLELAFASLGRDQATFDVGYQIGDRNQFNAGVDFDQLLSPRYFAVFSHNGRSPSSPSFNVGGSLRERKPGVIAGVSMQISPGVLATVEYQSQPPFSESAGFDNSFRLTINTDFAVNRGRLQAASSASVDRSQGGVAGQLRVDGNLNRDYNLEDALITAEKIGTSKLTRVATRTDRQGNFFIGHLPGGLYQVNLDPAGLPVELTPQKTKFIAEVKHGAVTNFDFVVRPEFGVAGRVTDTTGQSMVGMQVELIDSTGKKMKSVVTDQFGLYRIDGVGVGQYTLKVSSDSLAAEMPTATRKIKVEDFLFDQNLQVNSTEVGPS